MSDKFTAVWVSHSSIGDFLTCPQLYYYNNVYKDKKTGRKIQLMTPPLALGQTVHNVIESLSVLPKEKRFDNSLFDRFEKEWEKISGEMGGFFDKDVEKKYKDRGEEMIRKLKANPGPLKDLAVKIEMDLPHYWLSEKNNIILCGKIDWLEYIEDSNSVHIIDFKTGKSSKENQASLQLPIYHLLVHNCQDRKAEKASYWYLETNRYPTEKDLPELEESHEKVLAIAKKIKLARQLESYECPEGKKGCRACKPLKEIIDGKGKYVGEGEYGKDIYILEPQKDIELKSSTLH